MQLTVPRANPRFVDKKAILVDRSQEAKKTQNNNNNNPDRVMTTLESKTQLHFSRVKHHTIIFIIIIFIRFIRLPKQVMSVSLP